MSWAKETVLGFDLMTHLALGISSALQRPTRLHTGCAWLCEERIIGFDSISSEMMWGKMGEGEDLHC